MIRCGWENNTGLSSLVAKSRHQRLYDCQLWFWYGSQWLKAKLLFAICKFCWVFRPWCKRERRRNEEFERNAKKVYHDYTIIDKGLGLDIPGRSKVPKSFCDLFEFHKAIFKDAIFVAIFIFLSLKMLEFIKVLGIKLVCKNPGNFGLRKTGVSAYN